MPNRQQKKQQIFFRLTAFAGRRWRLVFSFESSGQVAPMMEVQKFTDLFFNKFTCQLVNLPNFF